MNVSENLNGLVMPDQFTAMGDDQVEYDAGFFWVVPCAIASIACTAFSWGVTAASLAGYQNDTLTDIGHAATVVGAVTGVASGVGTLWTATSATSTASLAMATADLSINPGMGVATWYL